MKRFCSLLLCAILALSLISCTEIPLQKENYSIQLFSNEASDYTIVYAKDDPVTKEFASQLASLLSKLFKVKIERVDNETLSTPADHEIILGAARECASSVMAKMTKPNDFALEVQENKLILCGKNEVCYNYLLDYLEREVFSKAVDGALTLSTADDVVYSSSKLAGTNFMDYWKAGFEDKEKISTSNLMTLALIMMEEHTFTDSNSKTLPYRLYLPFNYDAEKEYPVILFLHGSSTRGSDNTRHIMRTYVANMLSHDDVGIDEAIIVAPQCPSGENWLKERPSNEDGKAINYSVDKIAEADTMHCVVELLDHVLGTYSADKNRVYVTGMSMGGYGSWDIITRHTEYFAGALILCGVGDPSKAERLVDLPIWTIHGAKDDTISVENTRELVEAIKNAGGTKIKYDEYPDMGHDIEGYTALREELFVWLFSQTKQSANAETE